MSLNIKYVENTVALAINFAIRSFKSEKLIGGTELENCLNQIVQFFEAALRLTLVKIFKIRRECFTISTLIHH